MIQKEGWREGKEDGCDLFGCGDLHEWHQVAKEGLLSSGLFKLYLTSASLGSMLCMQLVPISLHSIITSISIYAYAHLPRRAIIPDPTNMQTKI